MNPTSNKDVEQELDFQNEVVYKSSPIMDPRVTPSEPPPLTRTLNIELQALGELNFAFYNSQANSQDNSLDNIVEC